MNETSKPTTVGKSGDIPLERAVLQRYETLSPLGRSAGMLGRGERLQLMGEGAATFAQEIIGRWWRSAEPTARVELPFRSGIRRMENKAETGTSPDHADSVATLPNRHEAGGNDSVFVPMPAISPAVPPVAAQKVPMRGGGADISTISRSSAFPERWAPVSGLLPPESAGRMLSPERSKSLTTVLHDPARPAVSRAASDATSHGFAGDISPVVADPSEAAALSAAGPLDRTRMRPVPARILADAGALADPVPIYSLKNTCAREHAGTPLPAFAAVSGESGGGSSGAIAAQEKSERNRPQPGASPDSRIAGESPVAMPVAGRVVNSGSGPFVQRSAGRGRPYILRRLTSFVDAGVKSRDGSGALGVSGNAADADSDGGTTGTTSGGKGTTDIAFLVPFKRSKVAASSFGAKARYPAAVETLSPGATVTHDTVEVSRKGYGSAVRMESVERTPVFAGSGLGVTPDLQRGGMAAVDMMPLAGKTAPSWIDVRHPESRPQFGMGFRTAIHGVVQRATEQATQSDIAAPEPLSASPPATSLGEGAAGQLPVAPVEGPDLERLADRVYAIIEQRLIIEKERRGL